VWVSREAKGVAKLGVNSLYPPYVFTSFSFVCKNLVDEEMFFKEGFSLKRERGLFVKAPEQKLPAFYSVLASICSECIVLKNNTGAFISEASFLCPIQQFVCTQTQRIFLRFSDHITSVVSHARKHSHL